MYFGCSGNTKTGQDWNLYHVQNRTEGKCGAKLGGYDCKGQRRHCDSEGSESRNDKHIGN
jgi:hypothetical protein